MDSAHTSSSRAPQECQWHRNASVDAGRRVDQVWGMEISESQSSDNRLYNNLQNDPQTDERKAQQKNEGQSEIH